MKRNVFNGEGGSKFRDSCHWDMWKYAQWDIRGGCVTGGSNSFIKRNEKG